MVRAKMVRMKGMRVQRERRDGIIILFLFHCTTLRVLVDGVEVSEKYEF